MKNYAKFLREANQKRVDAARKKNKETIEVRDIDGGVFFDEFNHVGNVEKLSRRMRDFANKHPRSKIDISVNSPGGMVWGETGEGSVAYLMDTSGILSESEIVRANVEASLHCRKARHTTLNGKLLDATIHIATSESLGHRALFRRCGHNHLVQIDSNNELVGPVPGVEVFQGTLDQLADDYEAFTPPPHVDLNDVLDWTQFGFEDYIEASGGGEDYPLGI